MRSDRKRPRAPESAVRVRRALRSSRDPTSRNLDRLGKKLGNSGLDARIARNAQHRDALLAFIQARLSRVAFVQQQEALEIGDQREWFREVARGQAGFHLPDPTRWHESAEAYKRAVLCLIAGNLGEGARQLDRAVALERAAWDSVPMQVLPRTESDERAPAGAPDELAHIAPAAACPRTEAREQLALVAKILNVQTTLEDSPPIPRRKRRPWWEEEEEEDEEEDEE